MKQTSVIQIRVDKQLKTDAELLFHDLGLDIPSAIRLFLKQSIAKNGIPFPLSRQDDFYNPHNIAHLKKILLDLNEGKTERHDLIEAG
ncbi:MAG: type II toxin-antitoxin system RelB/DinJ family antitoxin [Treponemataceae bacterium]|nr:MAG: type II toxin-antitoxin system RelB/DinJ family antitoxin [Treponemataceae bacterium]